VTGAAKRVLYSHGIPQNEKIIVSFSRGGGHSVNILTCKLLASPSRPLCYELSLELSGLALRHQFHSLCAVMLLTAQSPINSRHQNQPAIPLAILAEIGRVMAEHAFVRLVPIKDAVTIDEAAQILSVQPQFIREMLSFGVLKRAAGSGDAEVRLDSVLAYQEQRAKSPPRNALDEFFDELKAEGLY